MVGRKTQSPVIQSSTNDDLRFGERVEHATGAVHEWGGAFDGDGDVDKFCGAVGAAGVVTAAAVHLMLR